MCPELDYPHLLYCIGNIPKIYQPVQLINVENYLDLFLLKIFRVFRNCRGRTPYLGVGLS